jgi:beta-xylosidase
MKNKLYFIILSLILFSFYQAVLFAGISGENGNPIWNPDNGDGTYKNPIIFADYSDPDVVRLGDDFYMTASSFNCVPALPILRSKDLINWEIINHAIKRFPDPAFDEPQHGNGVWAPSIRFHEGWFYIYYGDPDRGIFMLKTKDPYGEWSAPVLVKKAYGNIDPCPLWDDDGSVYLVHAFAHSRAGVKSLLQVVKLNSDGSKAIDQGTIVFDGHKDYPTIEGPKFYKRNGYYYIFAPAGGVSGGWQTVLRSKNIYGPYEDRIVLHQGDTGINGPHQGGYVELENGEGWFVHFQDKGVYGRIIHLQPVKWVNDWPVMGTDEDGDGKGEPVLSYKKPDVGQNWPVVVPQTNDEFDSQKLGLQWQWHGNEQDSWFSLAARPGWLRLFCAPKPEKTVNLWSVPNLLLQKFPAPELTVTTKLELENLAIGDRAGLVIMGIDYSYIAVERAASGYKLINISCKNAEKNGREVEQESADYQSKTIFLQVKMDSNAVCNFSYSKNGKEFTSLGKPFPAREGKWIGAKVGLFCLSQQERKPSYADFDWFRFE